MSVSVKTIREEIEPFVEKLSKAHDVLAAEVKATDKAVDDLQADYRKKIQAFLEKNLPALSGPEFDRLDKLTEGFSKEPGSPLSEFLLDLLTKRAHGLTDASAAMRETVTIESFPAHRRAVQAEKASTELAMKNADAIANAARTAEDQWRQTEDYNFYNLDDDLVAHGHPGLSKETRSYYDTQSLTLATLRYLTRDDSYRNVRRVLVAYDQGADGRDIFEKMQGIRDSAKAFKDATAQTAADYGKAKERADRTSALLDRLDAQRPFIVDDATLLDTLRNQLEKNCQNPAFLKALADEFGPDFPTEVPALVAKMKPLQSLLTDETARLQHMASDLKTAQDTYTKLKNADGSIQIPNLDVKDLAQGNMKYLDTYLSYVDAASQSRSQTSNWHYSAAPQDNGLGIWNYILLYEVFSSSSAPAAAAPAHAPNLGLPDMQTLFSSPVADIKLNDIFNHVVHNTGGVDLNPHTYSHSSYDSSSTTYSAPSMPSFDFGGMSSGGSMSF